MGAALTYARRYALFTLVGIAGEDALDAPDLNGSTQLKAGDIGTAGRPVGTAVASATNLVHAGRGAGMERTPLRRFSTRRVPPICETSSCTRSPASVLQRRPPSGPARLCQPEFKEALLAAAVELARGARVGKAGGLQAFLVLLGNRYPKGFYRLLPCPVGKKNRGREPQIYGFSVF
jgi:hypothetical protein